MKEIIISIVGVIIVTIGIALVLLFGPHMGTSDIVNIVCAGAALIFAIVIGAIQIYQSRKITEFEQRLDDRDENDTTSM